MFPEAEEPAPGTGILRAMVLGDRATLDREVEIDCQKTGTFHALVVSGLHVGILAFAVVALLRLTAIPLLLQSVLALAVVAAYALLAGGNVPVVRASWMIAAYLLTRLLYRQRRALNVIASTALIFLVIDPALVFDAGFQMSFLSVALIAGVAAPLLERTLEPFRRSLGDLANVDLDLHLAPRVAQYRVSLRRALDPLAVVIGVRRRLLYLAVCVGLRVVVWAGELCMVSLVVQAGMALPMAIHFQRVSLSGISANLLIMPLLMLAIPAGLIAISVGWQWPAALALWCADSIAGVVAWHAEHIPLDLRAPPSPVWLCVLFGASLIWLAMSFERGRAARFASAAAALISLAVLVVHPFPAALQRGMFELTAIDVGQGESLFLGLPDGRTMLVDGGGLPSYGGSIRSRFDIGESVVSPYLWSRSIRRLDVIAVTHADNDHIGGVPALLENFDVGELWLAAGPDDERMLPLLEAARGRGVPVRRFQGGDCETLGAVAIEVLSPVVEASIGNRKNDDSLVLRASYGNQSFLLTGDIEKRAEQVLLAGPLLGPQTVLKLAHHGSRTSTSPQFLDRVQPAFAIVSSGYRNSYGHPHPDVVRRLNRRGVNVLRTDQDGLVSVATDGERIFVSTFRWERLARNLDSLPPVVDADE
jgi:competence protein ComEC